MRLYELPYEIILKIIDLPWKKGYGRGHNKQIKIDYKNKNPYNSLIKVNKEFNKIFSDPNILIPVMASYSARQFVKTELIYIGKQLSISLDKDIKVREMKQCIYDKIKEYNINDKGHNATRRKNTGIDVDWFLKR